MKTNKILFLALLFVTVLSACKKNNNDPIQEGIQRSELIFTEITGGNVVAHSDHFDGLASGVEGKKIVVKFDANGKATANGHLHLEADGVYKIELKAWDYSGKEVHQDYIASKAVADNYKAFLVGGNLTLNVNSSSESGAIFQPRETKHGDGTDVTGSGGTGTVGVVSYFTLGHDNEGEVDLSYVLRRVNAGVKPTITRKDWNHTDYANKFAGQDVLKLNFEIHAEH